MNDMDIWGRHIAGRGQSMGTGAKVRAALACMKASRRLIWLGKNGKKNSKI